MPIVLSEGEAKAIAERALSEGRIARDSLACALPPSRLAVTPGDLLSVRSGDADAIFRIDRIEEAGHRAVSAVRIEAGVYEAPVRVPRAARAPVVAAQSPVDVEFLDLPLLTGDEDPIAPHVAVARSPWAGPVAVFSAADDYGYALDREVKRPAVVRHAARVRCRPARPGSGCAPRCGSAWRPGALQSRSEADVLGGANAAALRFGSAGDWEVVQFLTAELVAPREYLVGGFLRGQAGTDAVMPDLWPAGTDFVLLDGAVGQLDLPSAARGRERHFRVGPAVRVLRRSELCPSRGDVRRRRPAAVSAGASPRRAAGGSGHRAGLDPPHPDRRGQLDGAGRSAGRGARGVSRARRAGRGGRCGRSSAGAPRLVYTAAEQAEDGAGGGR